MSNILWATFCGLVIIKLERALFEFYGSLDVGLNLSVRKLHGSSLTATDWHACKLVTYQIRIMNFVSEFMLKFRQIFLPASVPTTLRWFRCTYQHFTHANLILKFLEGNRFRVKHFLSRKLQEAHRWNVKRLKQDSEKACGLQFQTHVITTRNMLRSNAISTEFKELDLRQFSSGWNLAVALNEQYT